jgi:hypothetical protein
MSVAQVPGSTCSTHALARSIKTLGLAVAMMLPLGCHRPTGDPELTGTRVLFIGNSLTAANDLPRMLTAVAAAGGFTVSTSQVVFNDFSLTDHLLRGTAAAAIQSREWDYVVLQQGPSGQPASRVQLVDAARQFGGVITGRGAVPALYMVWPDASRRTAFDSVSASYTEAAEAAEALLFPGADAWVKAWERKASLPLYGSDAFHPSQLGSYLIALTIYAVLCDQSPTTLPVRPNGIGGSLIGSTSDADLRLLQEAAAEATTGLQRKGTCMPTTDVSVNTGGGAAFGS